MKFLELNGFSRSCGGLAALLAALGSAAALAACGGGSAATTEDYEPWTTLSRSEIARLGEPRIAPPKGPPPKRLVVKTLRKGSGAPAAVTDELSVDFVAAPYGTGNVRWRTRNRLEPFTFHLGAYDIVPGWERGLDGMRVGGRREIIVPSSGSRNARIYVVDLLAAQPGQPPAFGASDGPQEADLPAIELVNPRPPKKLVVKEMRKGSGSAVEPPAEAVVKLYGLDYETGVAFLNAWGPDRTTTLPLRNPRSIWTKALAGMRVGGRRKLIVPANLAFGGAPLLFVAELVSIG